MFIEMMKDDGEYYTRIIVNIATIEYIEECKGKTYVHFKSGEEIRVKHIDLDDIDLLLKKYGILIEEI